MKGAVIGIVGSASDGILEAGETLINAFAQEGYLRPSAPTRELRFGAARFPAAYGWQQRRCSIPEVPSTWLLCSTGRITPA